MQKNGQMNETLINGYSSDSTQQELSNAGAIVQHTRIQTILKYV